MGRKKKTLKKLVFIIFLIIAFFFITSYLNEKEQKRKVLIGIENEIMIVNEYYVYGTHFNITGVLSDIPTTNIKDIKIVLLDKRDSEKVYDTIYEIKENNIQITTSKLINKGIYLDNIESGEYYGLLKIIYENGNVKYYSMKNNTNYSDIEYYTITKDKENKKISIGFKESSIEDVKIPYMNFDVEKVKLPSNVYDIAIDPGHGGSDPGAVKGKYKESDIVIKYGIKLKEELEKLGLKVILTRDGTEDTSKESKFNAYSVYNYNGRVNIVGRSKAKYNFSIHANSFETNTISGVEIYAPENASLVLAQALADNVVNTVNTTYSNRDINRVSDGVYVRTFTEEEIEESNEDAEEAGYAPYNIETTTPYLYMIRETGGVVTGAYVDGRNKDYGKNEYYNSNIGIESYLIELGYIINKDDLNNMLSNEDLYVKAIVQAIKENIYK